MWLSYESYSCIGKHINTAGNRVMLQLYLRHASYNIISRSRLFLYQLYVTYIFLSPITSYFFRCLLHHKKVSLKVV